MKVLPLLTLFAAITLAAKAPNFVVIYIDDLGWAQTSVEMIEGDPETRSDYFQTPNLERLAEGGRVLSACYSPAPLCAPSRNSLLHGMTLALLHIGAQALIAHGSACRCDAAARWRAVCGRIGRK